MARPRIRGSSALRDATAAPAAKADLILGEGGTLSCEGPWTLPHLPGLERRIARITWPAVETVVCDASGITAMDTGGAMLLQQALEELRRRGVQVELQGLREDLAVLLETVARHWDRVVSGPAPRPSGRLEHLGRATVERMTQAVSGLGFLGQSAVELVRAVLMPLTVRWRAVVGSLQTDGFNALPIVGLLSFLMGVVIAYQGAEQLKAFGANIFVVDLVGISLLREIAPLVTAILVAGRSGSAYTAEIGTMKVTEELDAIRTLGLSPMRLLVLPKVFALVVALPLLTVYADAVGVFGGMLIARSELGVSYTEFLARFESAIALRHLLIGIGKAPVFAIIIALVGCYQGFQIRGGVDDVGRHTTISVVQSIFLVIVFDAFASVLLSWWNL